MQRACHSGAAFGAAQESGAGAEAAAGTVDERYLRTEVKDAQRKASEV